MSQHVFRVGGIQAHEIDSFDCEGTLLKSYVAIKNSRFTINLSLSDASLQWADLSLDCRLAYHSKDIPIRNDSDKNLEWIIRADEGRNRIIDVKLGVLQDPLIFWSLIHSFFLLSMVVLILF